MKKLSKVAYLPYLALVVLTAVYGIATVSRNKVWSSEETLWQDTAAKAPDKARPQMNLGKRYMDMAVEKKDPFYFDKAKEHLSKAVELKTDSYEAFHNLGLVFEKMGESKIAPAENFMKARENYIKAIDLISKTINDFEARKKKQGKYDEALRTTLEKQLGFFRNRAATICHDLAVSYEHNDQGDRYGEGFNLSEAVRAWDKSLEYEPHNDQMLRNKTIALVFGGDIDNAVASSQKLISLGKYPNFIAELYSSGFTSYKEGKKRDALNFLETALELAPSGEVAEEAKKIIAEIIRRNNN